MAGDKPFPEGKYFETPSGYTIHYHETGERGADRPSVLFLHGSGPGASGYWCASTFLEHISFPGRPMAARLPSFRRKAHCNFAMGSRYNVCRQLL